MIPRVQPGFAGVIRSRIVLRLLVDTSVWLDLARSRDGQALIVPIRVLKHWKRIELLVPQVVIEEFERNRPNAEARVSQSVADRFRELWRDCMSTLARTAARSGSRR